MGPAGRTREVSRVDGPQHGAVGAGQRGRQASGHVAAAGPKYGAKAAGRGGQGGGGHACSVSRHVPAALCMPAAFLPSYSPHLATTTPLSPAWLMMCWRAGGRGLGSARTSRGPTICSVQGRAGQGRATWLVGCSAVVRHPEWLQGRPQLALSLGGRLRGVLSPHAVLSSTSRAPRWVAGAVGASARSNSRPRRCDEASASGTAMANAILDTTAFMTRSRKDCVERLGRGHACDALA